MYYIFYGPLYLASLLPFAFLYLISDGLYVISYYILGYRKKVVMNNLNIAFPEKTKKERVRIAKKFYKNFCDNIVESIKLLSMSDAMFDERVNGDFSLVDKLAGEGKNVQLHIGHQFNWEYCNLVIARNTHVIPFVGVYGPITNKAFNKIIYDIRAKYGTVMIAKPDFAKQYRTFLTQRYVLALGADQNPVNPGIHYWMNFFSKPVAFITGPAKSAVKNNLAVVFLRSRKVKRGYYVYECTEVTSNAAAYTPEKLTIMYRDYLVKTIREEPDNYLWSHKRWKYEYKDECKKNWIDN
ncbi:MAG: lysophospholipid acyltransferase family protein [Sphingobacteriales bacterium]|nr:lysophospholipid acyltransferase family protein [Sphingobacteriales bacterium]